MVDRVGAGRFWLEMSSAWKMENLCVWKNFLLPFLKILGGCFFIPYAWRRSSLRFASLATNPWLAWLDRIQTRRLKYIYSYPNPHLVSVTHDHLDCTEGPAKPRGLMTLPNGPKGHRKLHLPSIHLISGWRPVFPGVQTRPWSATKTTQLPN